MKKNDTDLLLLSAYIDDELTPIEKNLVEEKLKTSAELRAELENLRKIKSQVNSIQSLQPDPFFDTRLLAALETDKSSWKRFFAFRKPVVTFGLLTVLLALFLKFEPTLLTDFYESKKSDLVEFYTSNLKPYLFTSKLTSEDLFNFAFNKFLPLNEDKTKILSLEHDSDGNEIAEIKYSAVGDAIFNMDSFVKTFSLNELEKKKVDSILLVYNDKISSKILVNENNTFALNKDIWTYQNLLKAELLNVAKNANQKVFASIVSEPKVEDFNSSLIKLRELKNDVQNVYVCINPDTVFSIELNIDEDRLKSEFRSARAAANEELEKANKEIEQANKALNENFKVFVHPKTKNRNHPSNNTTDVVVYSDTQSFKIKIPGMNFPVSDKKKDNLSVVKWMDFAIGQLKEFNIEMRIDSFSSQNSFSFTVSPNKNSRKKNLQVTSVGDGNFVEEEKDNQNYYFNNEDASRKAEYKSINLDSLLRNFNFEIKEDSIVIENYNSKEIDSIWKHLPGNIKEEMKILKRELDQLRREMNTWKKEVPRNPK